MFNKDTKYNPVIYVFINKSLNMSAGKVAAQAAHAAAYSFARNNTEDNDLWLTSPHKTVIVLEARDTEHLRAIADYLRVRGIQNEFIIDEGANEVPSISLTALVTGMMDKNKNTDLVMSSFDLYKEDATTIDLVQFMKGAESLFGRPF